MKKNLWKLFQMVHESDCEQILNYLLLIENNSENSSNLTLTGPEGSPEKKTSNQWLLKFVDSTHQQVRSGVSSIAKGNHSISNYRTLLEL